MVLAVIFGATLLWVRGRIDARMAELEGDHRRHVAKLESEADARTARVERASQADARRRGVALAEDLLPVADALRLAVQVEPGDGIADVREGVELARRELARAFEAHEIVEISPQIGEAFDPSRHEAVELRGSGKKIVATHRVGFEHSGRVLRPAMVAVGGDTEETDDFDEEE